MRALRKIAWVETKLFLREPLTVVFSFGFPLIVLFVLADVFGTTPDTNDNGTIVFRGVAPVSYYVPAYVALVVAAIGLISIPVHLASYREHGVLRRLRASGVTSRALLGSQVVVGTGIALVSGLILVGAAQLVYGVSLPDSPGGAAAAFLLVAATFGALGVLLASLLPNPRAAQGAGLLLFFVMMFVSGAGPPPEVIGAPLRAVSQGLPLTHAIRLLQDPWLGFAWSPRALFATLGALLASAALSIRLFRWR